MMKFSLSSKPQPSEASKPSEASNQTFVDKPVVSPPVEDIEASKSSLVTPRFKRGNPKTGYGFIPDTQEQLSRYANFSSHGSSQVEVPSHVSLVRYIPDLWDMGDTASSVPHDQEGQPGSRTV